ncbi:oxygenase MpaB family protein [Gordonia sp. DT219]|uniref:oxygenase MpaB family protein n=1 Tax=Gordonia sp. DT219 TaxID=3416658 RepID=UPI003CED7619
MSTVSLIARRVGARRAERYRLRDDLARVDPAAAPESYARGLGTLEYPWGITMALSFALFRTYAVPSIGELLYETGEFTDRTQKRYDDTVLLLDAPVEHGFADPRGRAAIRRINQMHAMYDISNDDMLYVLATFVVCPVRWVAAYEWRPLRPNEIDGLTEYYRKLGKHMALKDIPDTYEAFEHFLEEYEREHFAYSPRSREVADSTLALLTTFMPFRLLPAWLVRRLSYALMDDPLLDAFRYPRPTDAERVVARAGLKARGLAIRFFARPRTTPQYGRDMPQIRCYPRGYDVDDLGTFTPGCPIHKVRGNPPKTGHPDYNPSHAI